MTTDTNSKQPASTVAVASTQPSAQPTATAPIKPASNAPPVAPAKPAETKVDTAVAETNVDTAVAETNVDMAITESGYKSEDYSGAPIVMLKLAKEGIMQYDSQYRLKLDSTEPTPMPLTPFFASRLNSTVLLCN